MNAMLPIADPALAADAAAQQRLVSAASGAAETASVGSLVRCAAGVEPTSEPRWSAATIGLGSAFMALAALFAAGVWSVATFGSLAAGLAFLAGETLYLPQPEIDVGDVAPGETVVVQIPVQNLTASPLTILGAETDCSCVVASGLPIVIGKRLVGFVSVRVAVASRGGDAVNRRVELLIAEVPTIARRTIHLRLTAIRARVSQTFEPHIQ